MKRETIKFLLLSIFALLASGATLLPSALETPRFTLVNNTGHYIFVARVRTVSPGHLKMYTKEPLNDTPVYAILPGRRMGITADDDSGYITYDRVLWVTNKLELLIEALNHKRLTPSTLKNDSDGGRFAGAVYIGRHQRGIKHLALDATTRTFELASTQAAALKRSNIDAALNTYITDFVETLQCKQERWDPFYNFGIRALEDAGPHYDACAQALMQGITNNKKLLRKRKPT